MRSPLVVLFTTVLVDLMGFGMIVPLITIYGKHFGAGRWELAILGASYSVMQFLFAPVWGALSDRAGRRPILIGSLFGASACYLLFAFADSVGELILARALGGLFAANIAAAQAYIADVTTAQDRAKGMGLLGAAFGLGFTIGPPLGGISAIQLGLAAPGLIAASVCGANALLAVFRLPESLPREARATRFVLRFPFGKEALGRAFAHPWRGHLLAAAFLVTFAFAAMEQTYSLFFQHRFGFATEEASYRTGLILMWAALLGAVVQGGLMRRLAPRYGEWKLLGFGLAANLVTAVIFPFGPTYLSYLWINIPFALGFSLANPCLTSLISRSAEADRQGEILGLSQGLSSLARALGPFLGLLAFSFEPTAPYLMAAASTAIVLLIWASAAGRARGGG